MSGVATAIIGTGIVSTLVANESGRKAGNQAMDAAQLQSGYQMEALNYLKEQDRLPTQFRDQSLQRIAGLLGLQGGTGAQFQDVSQQDRIQQAIQSPLYGAIMGGQQAGEDAIMRNAAATGGLRSGNVQGAMYDYNTQLKNKALLESYNQQLSQEAMYGNREMQGLQTLLGQPTNANNIASMTSGIGETLASGRVAQATANQAGQQQGLNNILSTVNLGLQAYGGGNMNGGGGYPAGQTVSNEYANAWGVDPIMYSDRRLKKNIRLIGTVKGFNWYTWKWNGIAEKMGLTGDCQGCMAEEVFAVDKDAIIMKDLFMMVNYGKIGVFNHA